MPSFMVSLTFLFVGPACLANLRRRAAPDVSPVSKVATRAENRALSGFYRYSARWGRVGRRARRRKELLPEQKVSLGTDDQFPLRILSKKSELDLVCFTLSSKNSIASSSSIG